ncbi:heavy metal translocating P-type ATPase [Cerasicoccus fimbriatus]|uniref:heavy metal translocating P-type ATPase n=1 Tax=Cerasicoccus fimbriatus TaxID=3014554 RepID=UPI0022B49209|nr:heavy metal translocating P-type ATPase [Cerasicoccus sp. TK19100]
MADDLPNSCCHTDASPGVTEDERAWTMTWLKVGVAAVMAGQGMIFGLGLNTSETPLTQEQPIYWVLHMGLLISALVVIALLAPPLLQNAWQAMREKRITVEALFLISALGALGASLTATLTGEGSVYYEVVAIVLAIYTVGKTLGSRSRERALDAVRELRDAFDFAYLQTCCGQRRRVPVAELANDSEVSVAPGEPVPVDGVIRSGVGDITDTAVTGELAPTRRQPGDQVWAGSYSVDGTFVIEPRALTGERRIDAVLEAVEQARLKPSELQLQADRLMRWFVPSVIAIAAVTFLAWAMIGPWTTALFNAMAVLLVACPCALGLATPIAVWSQLLQFSRLGLTVRTGDFGDQLAQADRIVFDKTGTLSFESLRVEDMEVAPSFASQSNELLAAVRAVESLSPHPVARALAQIEVEAIDIEPLEVTQHPGHGVEAVVRLLSGREARLRIGSRDFVEQSLSGNVLTRTRTLGSKREVLASLDGEFAAAFDLSEQLRPDLEPALRALQEQGVTLSILTGDPKPAQRELAGVAVECGLTPADKLDRVTAWQASGERVVFVGDGLNDAAAMSHADASIAMGQGADLSRAASPAVLMGDSLMPIARGLTLSRKVRRAVRGNLLFAGAYNFLGMGLAAGGILHPVVAALLMLFSSVGVSVRAARSARMETPQGGTGVAQ